MTDSASNVLHAEALAIDPPVAKRVPFSNVRGPKPLQDDYAWLQNKNDSEVIAYLEIENRYSDSWLAPTVELQKKLYGEMLSHIKETDESVPYRHRDYFYYSRTVEGSQYPIFCRKMSTLDAPEEIVLDVNELAKGEQYMAVGAMAIADDQNLLAYSTDNTGFRQYTLHVKNLKTGEVLADTAERVGSVTWALGAEILFYSVEDEETKRQYRLYRHRLGEPQSSDVLVFEEKDERF